MGSHSTAFNVPLPFAFMGPVEDEVKKVSVTHSQLHKEAEKRCNEMEQTVTKMIEEQNEVWRHGLFYIILKLNEFFLPFALLPDDEQI